MVGFSSTKVLASGVKIPLAPDCSWALKLIFFWSVNCDAILFTPKKRGVSLYFKRTKLRRSCSSLVFCMAWLYKLLSLCKNTGPYFVQPKKLILKMTNWRTAKSTVSYRIKRLFITKSTYEIISNTNHKIFKNLLTIGFERPGPRILVNTESLRILNLGWNWSFTNNENSPHWNYDFRIMENSWNSWKS